MKSYSTLLCLFLALQFSNAQIVTFNFTASPFLQVTSKDPNVSVTDVALVPSGTISTNVTTGTYFPNEPYIQGTNGWTATSQSTAKGFCFTITPAAGYEMDLTDVSFNGYSTAAGPSAAGIKVGSSFYSETNIPNGGTVTAVSASLSTHDNITVATQICMQGWLNGSRTSAGTGDFRVDDFSVSGTVSLIPLAVDLSHFSVQAEIGNGYLTFTTASEQNNAHFEIERSADSRNFTKIGEVKGAGTTTQQQDYKFIDEQPLKGINYYRLKQVDFDGTSTYSKVVSVRFGNTRTLSVIPTMVYDQIKVELDEMGEQEGQWQIFDLNGRQVLSGTLAGDQTSFQTDLTGLNEGTYLVRVQIGEDVLTEKVQKL